jgi:hypothetical protein
MEMNSTCDYQSACTGAKTIAYLQYEADADLDYSLEFGGVVYGWEGFICASCMAEAIALIKENPPYRYRAVPAEDVPTESVPNTDWRRHIPHWSKTFIEVGNFATPMPTSPKWLAYWQKKLESGVRRTFITPYDQYAEREGQPFKLILPILEPSTAVDRENLPLFLIEFGDGHQCLAWPEEVIEGFQEWQHNPL